MQRTILPVLIGFGALLTACSAPDQRAFETYSSAVKNAGDSLDKVLAQETDWSRDEYVDKVLKGTVTLEDYQYGKRGDTRQDRTHRQRLQIGHRCRRVVGSVVDEPPVPSRDICARNERQHAIDNELGQATRARSLARIPLGRLGEVEDLMGVAINL